MTLATPIDSAKFRDPERTADGAARARVALERLETLWLNTGSLCNLECGHCYIESSPANDRLAYLSHAEAVAYLDEIDQLQLGTRQIGLTGGEPFMNPDAIPILETALDRGFDVLVLTNAMKPMAHKREALLTLKDHFGDRLALRVSVDHYTAAGHDKERGAGSWTPMLEGLRFLSHNGFAVSVAGRQFTGEDEAALRTGYAGLFRREGVAIDANDPQQLVLFPEMDALRDVPEITGACWDILDVRPSDQMCASARMVIKRKGAENPAVVACTLIAYDQAFEFGPKLADSLGSVALNHPYCAQFCVLGGASCAP